MECCCFIWRETLAGLSLSLGGLGMLSAEPAGLGMDEEDAPGVCRASGDWGDVLQQGQNVFCCGTDMYQGKLWTSQRT